MNPAANLPHPDPERIALGIRQPWAELILRGIKTVEVRSQNTQVRGRIYLYASKKPAEAAIALEAAERFAIDLQRLPYGVIVGTVRIVESTPCRPEDAAAACVPRASLKGRFAWHLSEASRLQEPLPVRFVPYGVWFYPFRRRK